MVELDLEEVICLYQFMKKEETALDNCLVRLLSKVERTLYQRMSIAEIERLTSSET